MHERTRADAIEVTYTPVGGASAQKLRFEPWSGNEATHELVELTWTGCAWRRAGSELVELLDIVAPEREVETR